MKKMTLILLTVVSILFIQSSLVHAQVVIRDSVAVENPFPTVLQSLGNMSGKKGSFNGKSGAMGLMAETDHCFYEGNDSLCFSIEDSILYGHYPGVGPISWPVSIIDHAEGGQIFVEILTDPEDWDRTFDGWYGDDGYILSYYYFSEDTLIQCEQIMQSDSVGYSIAYPPGGRLAFALINYYDGFTGFDYTSSYIDSGTVRAQWILDDGSTLEIKVTSGYHGPSPDAGYFKITLSSYTPGLTDTTVVFVQAMNPDSTVMDLPGQTPIQIVLDAGAENCGYLEGYEPPSVSYSDIQSGSVQYITDIEAASSPKYLGITVINGDNTGMQGNLRFSARHLVKPAGFLWKTLQDAHDSHTEYYKYDSGKHYCTGYHHSEHNLYVFHDQVQLHRLSYGYLDYDNGYYDPDYTDQWSSWPAAKIDFPEGGTFSVRCLSSDFEIAMPFCDYFSDERETYNYQQSACQYFFGPEQEYVKYCKNGHVEEHIYQDPESEVGDQYHTRYTYPAPCANMSFSWVPDNQHYMDDFTVSVDKRNDSTWTGTWSHIDDPEMTATFKFMLDWSAEFVLTGNPVAGDTTTLIIVEEDTEGDPYILQDDLVLDLTIEQDSVIYGHWAGTDSLSITATVGEIRAGNVRFVADGAVPSGEIEIPVTAIGSELTNYTGKGKILILPESIEIIKADNIIADELRISTWKNAFSQSEFIQVWLNDNFIDDEPERFYIRVTDVMENKDTNKKETIYVSVQTTIDNANDIELKETDDNSGVFQSKSQLLVANDLGDVGSNNEDDGFSGKGCGTDETKDDRTHKSVVGGKLTVLYKNYSKEVDVWKDKKTVKVNSWILIEPFEDDGFIDSDGNTVLGVKGEFDWEGKEDGIPYSPGIPCEPYMDISKGRDRYYKWNHRKMKDTDGRGGVADDDYVRAQLKRANIAWAQAGICVDETGPIQVVNGKNPDSSGIDILDDAKFRLSEYNYVSDFFKNEPPLTAVAVFGFYISKLKRKGKLFDVRGMEAPGNPCCVVDVGYSVQYRTLAHELGHLLTYARDDSTVNHPWKFFPQFYSNDKDKYVEYNRRLRTDLVEIARQSDYAR